MIYPNRLKPLTIDVISVQSQVAYGHVGNSVAFPTLYSQGHEVVVVPTVLFSNVPHYDTLSGGPLPQEWFEGFLSDIERRGLLESAPAVLIGYLGSAEQARALAAWLERVTAHYPEMQVILDPVMGDYDSGSYVAPGVPAALRDLLVPLATGMSPNAYEFEQIVGRETRTAAATVEAARELLSGRKEWVVVTSAAPDESGEDELRIVIVTREGEEWLSFDRVNSAAKGTGDMFTAALLGYRLKGYGLREAVGTAHGDVARVLERTARLERAELVLSEMTPDR